MRLSCFYTYARKSCLRQIGCGLFGVLSDTSTAAVDLPDANDTTATAGTFAILFHNRKVLTRMALFLSRIYAFSLLKIFRNVPKFGTYRRSHSPVIQCSARWYRTWRHLCQYSWLSVSAQKNEGGGIFDLKKIYLFLRYEFLTLLVDIAYNRWVRNDRIRLTDIEICFDTLADNET